MPHQCVRCGELVKDGNRSILSGCEHCGGKLFFFIKEEKLEQIKKETKELALSDKQKQELEKDVFELVGKKKEDDEPVILDFESIRVLQPGKYELDLVNLFKKKPLIFKLSEGKYMIDLPTTFKDLHE